MNAIATKIITLSFLVLSAACSEKEAIEPKKKEEVNQRNEKPGEINFKVFPLPDKSTYKNPTF